MDHCDVLIVGGGPAGSTCARQLVRAGLDVVILDKSEFPRDKICAGWITPQVIESLALDREDYARGRVLQPISAFATGLVGRDPTQVRYAQTVSFGIRRCEFDDYLLRRCGARLLLGTAFASAVVDETSPGGWLVNGTLHTKLIIGAGGHFCPIARLLGAHLGKDERVIAAQEVEFELTTATEKSCSLTGERPELYFCDDLQGYGWAFRKGNFLNVGLGREGNHGLAEQVRQFWDDLAAQGKVPAGAAPRFKGHAYLLYPHATRRLVADRALLIGDAAGLAYAQSGEGIRPAIESGLLAAQTILGAAGDYRATKLAPYAQNLAARLGVRSADTSRSTPAPSEFRRRIGRRLLSNRWFARHVVLNRWFLHTQQSALSP